MVEIDSRLLRDCVRVGRFRLCHLLLMDDANYPWCILVPDRPDVREVHQLAPRDQQRLMRESSLLSRELAACFGADKMNLAALGNQVPQLHVHLVVRYRDDPAWPGPVWGAVPRRPYAEADREAVIERIRSRLEAADPDFRR